jgi:hypothetical protein
MARDHGRVFVSIWADPDFRKLDREAQRMYLLLMTQARLTYCGALDYMPGRLATLAADEDEESIQKAVNTLEMARFVVGDYVTSELLVRSFVRHDGLLSSPNMTKAMLKDRAALLSDCLRDAVDSELRRAYRDDPKMKGWGGFKQAAPDLFRLISAKGSGNPSEKGSGKR